MSYIEMKIADKEKTLKELTDEYITHFDTYGHFENIYYLENIKNIQREIIKLKMKLKG